MDDCAETGASSGFDIGGGTYDNGRDGDSPD